MNIMLVSKNAFFISGAISLIAQAWQPVQKSRPVFLVSEKDDPPLAPDIVITDLLSITTKEKRPARAKCLRYVHSRDRAVKITLAAHSCREFTFRCQQHTLFLGKSEAAAQLGCLFGNQRSALFLPSTLASLSQRGRPGSTVLSKQQEMVVKYTRQGLSLTDISRITKLSVKTISTHKRAVMRKLGIKSNSEFYQYTFGGLA